MNNAAPCQNGFHLQNISVKLLNLYKNIKVGHTPFTVKPLNPV